MKFSKWFNILLVFLSLLSCNKLLIAQSLPVGTPGLEDAYRRAQLLGKIDSTISFTSRPFLNEASLKIKNGFDPYNAIETGTDKKFMELSIFWGNGVRQNFYPSFCDSSLILTILIV